MPRSTDPKTVRRAIRMTPSDAAEIAARAQAHQMTFTDYMTRTALGLLDATEGQLRADLDALTARFDRLERQLAEQPSW